MYSNNLTYFFKTFWISWPLLLWNKGAPKNPVHGMCPLFLTRPLSKHHTYYFYTDIITFHV